MLTKNAMLEILTHRILMIGTETVLISGSDCLEVNIPTGLQYTATGCIVVHPNNY